MCYDLFMWLHLYPERNRCSNSLRKPFSSTSNLGDSKPGQPRRLSLDHTFEFLSSNPNSPHFLLLDNPPDHNHKHRIYLAAIVLVRIRRKTQNVHCAWKSWILRMSTSNRVSAGTRYVPSSDQVDV